MSTPAKLLLAGLSKDSQAEIKRLLPEHEYFQVTSVTKALALMEEAGPFDLSLLNVRMKGLTPLAFAPGPILFMGDGAGKVFEMAMEADLIWDWIEMPFEPGLFQNRVRNLLKCRPKPAEPLESGQISWQSHCQSLRTLSHDLRTPMATIGVTLSSIQRMLNKKPVAEILPKLDKIRRALEKQQEILEAVLKSKN